MAMRFFISLLLVIFVIGADFVQAGINLDLIRHFLAFRQLDTFYTNAVSLGRLRQSYVDGEMAALDRDVAEYVGDLNGDPQKSAYDFDKNNQAELAINGLIRGQLQSARERLNQSSVKSNAIS